MTRLNIVLESAVTGALPRAAFDYERMLQVFAIVIRAFAGGR